MPSPPAPTTTGTGYAIWYAVPPHLQATSAAALQLSVLAIAALGGIGLVIRQRPSTIR